MAQGRCSGDAGVNVLDSLWREIEHTSTPLSAGRCNVQSLPGQQRCWIDWNRSDFRALRLTEQIDNVRSYLLREELWRQDRYFYVYY
jgi:hypothetical protein